MKKRGSYKLFNSRKSSIETELYYTIFEIILVAMVVTALFAYLDSIRKDTLFEKTYLVKDLALMMNTIYAAPGNVRLSYAHEKLNLSEFNFNFINQKAAAAESTIEGALELKYPFIADSFFSEEIEQIMAQKEIAIQKTGSSIKIKNILPQQLNLLSCPVKEMPELEGKNIFIHEDSTEIMKNALKTALQTSETKSPETKLIIAFYATEEPGEEDIIKAYVNINGPYIAESEQLACRILNNILINSELDDFFNSGRIMPIEPAVLEDDNNLKILQNDRISFVIVFNLGRLDEIDFDKKRNALMPAIRQPIEELISK